MYYPKWLIALCATILFVLQPCLVQAAPQSGWWWNPAESGRGFAIEVQGDILFMGVYQYEANGRATWHLSANPTQPDWSYLGTIEAYGYGQTLSGAYKSSIVTNSNLGNVSLKFTDATHGTLTWPGGVVPIQRFVFSSGTPSFKPETGWWWNAAESGRGFFIEVQGSNNLLFMAGYMYDALGNPIWYAANGPMTTATLFRGSWNEYSGGQTMTGPYRQPAMSPVNAGSVTLQFTSSSTATLTLPDSRQIQLTRFNFLNPSVGVLTGNSADQAKFIAARGYPHIFTVGFVTGEVVGGVVVPLTPPRRVENWIYNDANVTSALFDNGFFISQETLGAHSNFQSTNLKPEMFRQGMTEAQVTAVAGQPTCVDSVQMGAMNMRFLRYAATSDSPVAAIGLIDGELASVIAGFLISDQANPGTNLCSAPF